MNQATQKVVAQSANMNLIQIRSFEIDYFQNFYSNFGTQAAILVGWIGASLSQVPGWDHTLALWPLLALYWISSALCICSGVHCLVCTVFGSVFGGGLALRGPPGSMVRAIKGMIAEQEQIFIAFNITIFSFGLQLIGMYFIMMGIASAIATSIITGIFMIFWYRYGLRLYNRFSWSGITVDWLGEEGDEGEKNPTDELNPDLVKEIQGKTDKYNQTKGKSINDYQKPKTTLSLSSKKENQSSPASRPGSTRGGGTEIGSPADDSKSVYSSASKQFEEDLESAYAASAHLKTSSLTGSESKQSAHDIVLATHGLTFGSYISLQERGKFTEVVWKRRYLTLNGYTLFYYKDKRAYEVEPDKPINKRPINLEGYTLVAGSSQAPYPITLVPYDPEDIRKEWKFRCDTNGEFEKWIQMFSIAIQSCNSNQEQGELVIVDADGKSEALAYDLDEIATYVPENEKEETFTNYDEREE
jgi:hypothetical protein